MYKDIEKQKEANRLAAQKRRDKAKGMTQGMTNSGYDVQGMTQPLTIEQQVNDNKPGQAIAIPEGLPEILHSRYMREAGYRQVIDRLIANTIDQLHAMRVFIPVWRYNLG